MALVGLSKLEHAAAGCRCGHGEHIGRGLGQQLRVICPECDAMEERELVTIAVEPLARVAQLALGEGAVVRLDGRSCRIVSAREIVKLDGRVRTGWVRIKVR